MRLSILFIFLACFATLSAQPPQGYYNSASGLYGTSLQQALHDIIDDHNVLSYDELWDAFEQTDKKQNGKVWDMYSDNPGGTPPYEFTFGSDQCGGYSGEGDCFNREHSWPKSWFSDKPPMYSDLFHLYPTDGYVNNRRSNYPFGEVGSASWISENGSKVGDCSAPGYSGTVFEPIDEYKGDFARTYFYMATRYYGEDNGWAGSPMTNGSQLKSWAVTMLLLWHQNDPVSQKEINRNNAVYSYQQNRNPFIDHPEYAPNIWSPNAGGEFQPGTKTLTAYPDPCKDYCTLSLPSEFSEHNTHILVYSITGYKVHPEITWNGKTAILNTSRIPQGIYLISVYSGDKYNTLYSKIVKFK